MDKTLEIEKLGELLSERLSDSAAKFAVLYGSIAAGKQTDSSDIDIALFCDEDEYLKIARLMSGGIFARRVDIVNLKKLALVDRYEILASGKLVYASPTGGEELYKKIKLDAMVQYLDFDYVRKRIFEDMQERIRKGAYGKLVAETQRT